MLRRALLILLVVFIIYAVVNDPSQSGDFTANLWGHVKDGISSIGTFFDTLLSS